MAASAKDAPLSLQEESLGAAARTGWVARLKHLLGLDRAIAFTVLARGTQILGSAGTVLLILHYLTPIEQGYYYTLLSLVSLQTVFELGFSFVILQMAAHECAHLTLHSDGRIEGAPAAHARLASILRKTFYWYLVAAAVFCAVLLPAGAYFFSRHARAAAPVAWHGPWVLAVVATTFMFLLNPYYSFLEGCGQVWQVGRMRFGQAMLGAALSWGALLSHHGMYSPGMVNVGYVTAGLIFLWTRRRLCIGLFRYLRRDRAFSWRREVWPFQWKIGVSWISTYVSMTLLTPLLFAYRGPAEAGQFGMSLGITAYLSNLVLAWISTKASPFGQMIARGEFARLKALFFQALRRSAGLLIAAAAACELAVVGLHYGLPSLAARMASPVAFALLLLACVGGFVVQSMAIYLRSFKREPFLIQSVIVAVLTVLISLATVKDLGILGMALSYFASTGIVGLILAVSTFRAWPAAVLAPDATQRDAAVSGGFQP